MKSGQRGSHEGDVADVVRLKDERAGANTCEMSYFHGCLPPYTPAKPSYIENVIKTAGSTRQS